MYIPNVYIYIYNFKTINQSKQQKPLASQDPHLFFLAFQNSDRNLALAQEKKPIQYRINVDSF